MPQSTVPASGRMARLRSRRRGRIARRTAQAAASANEPLSSRLTAHRCGAQASRIDRNSRLASATAENAIIALGTKYSIITPYTSMVVLPTNVLHEDLTLPAAKAVRLYQSGPNPFRATAMIQYAVPRLTAPQKLTLKVFDASGKLIRTLADELTLGGNFRIAWDATDALGRHVSPGFYLVVLNVGTVHKMMKIQFVK